MSTWGMFLSQWIIEALTTQMYSMFPGGVSITIPLAEVSYVAKQVKVAKYGVRPW